MTSQQEQMDPDARVEALREAIEAYVTGESGIRFEALARFAGPLFDLFDVTWRADAATEPAARDEEELSTMIAVLDTARLLWAYFGLDEEESVKWLPELEDALLGTGAGDEERTNLLVLLSLLEEHWHSFTETDRVDALQIPGYVLPKFEELLDAYSDDEHRLPSQGPSTYGPADLTLPEALAAFAEPLLHDTSVETEPERVQERMERAQAYWDLATAAPNDFDVQLERIVSTFAQDDVDERTIRDEAKEMVARFRTLFPEYEGPS